MAGNGWWLTGHSHGGSLGTHMVAHWARPGKVASGEKFLDDADIRKQKLKKTKWTDLDFHTINVIFEMFDFLNILL